MVISEPWQSCNWQKKMLKKFKLFLLRSLFLAASMMHLFHHGSKAKYLFDGFWKSAGIPFCFQAPIL